MLSDFLDRILVVSARDLGRGSVDVHLIRSFGSLLSHLLAIDELLQPFIGLDLLVGVIGIGRNELHLPLLALALLLGQSLALVDDPLGHLRHLCEVVVHHVFDLGSFPWRLVVDVSEVLGVCSMGLDFDQFLWGNFNIFLTFDTSISELVKRFQLTREIEPALIVVDGIFDLADAFLEA